MEKENDVPELIIHLRPTSPDRPNGLIDSCIEKFLKLDKEYDSARSITEIDNRFLKSCFINKENLLEPLWISDKLKPLEVWQQQRQNLPKIFKTDGRIDIIKTAIIKKNNLHGQRCFGFKTNLPLIDIDTFADIDGISERLKTNLSEYSLKK